MDMARVEAYLEAHRSDFEEQLKALIRIPSVSAQPDHNPTRAAPPSGCATTWPPWDSRPS